MLLVRALDERPPFAEQDEALVTYAEKLHRGRPPARPVGGGRAAELERIVRALSPHIGARVALENGSFLGVLAAHADSPSTRSRRGAAARRPPDGLRRLGPRAPAARRRAPARRCGPMSVSPARRAAHTVVVRTLQSGAYADRALHSASQGLNARDRALAKRLAFGAVQRRGTLDWICDRFAKEFDVPVRAALHLGLEQLLFLDGIADHAAIDESVELAKPSPGHRLVNAVLRRVQREGVELPADDTPAGAAIRHAHPEWLTELWWE